MAAERNKEDSDIEDLEMEGISEIDIHTQHTIFTINRINLDRPFMPLVFGIWNNWQLVKSEAKQLLEKMKTQGFNKFHFESMLPLVLAKSDVETVSIYKDIRNVNDAPFLTLTDAGKKAGMI
jgi:hypothetical protein